MGMTLATHFFGGPTVSFDLGGLTFMTDPTFDGPGDYPIGTRTLTKTAAASGSPADAGPVDVVLLSHDQHPDNLDAAGRDFCRTVPLVLCTPTTAERLGPPARALPTWAHVDLPRPDGRTATCGSPPSPPSTGRTAPNTSPARSPASSCTATACPPSTSAATTRRSAWSRRSPPGSRTSTSRSCSAAPPGPRCSARPT